MIRSLTLPTGLRLNPVFVSGFSIRRHFLRRNKYYVRCHIADKPILTIADRLSEAEAISLARELSRALESRRDEINAYEHGYEVGYKTALSNAQVFGFEGARSDIRFHGA
jgi:hypothetical protein